MTFYRPTITSVDGNPTVPKNAHHALIPKKTETTSYDAPILLAWPGANSFLYLFVNPATNFTPDHIFK
jgi:hypothetical protein